MTLKLEKSRKLNHYVTVIKRKPHATFNSHHEIDLKSASVQLCITISG